MDKDYNILKVEPRSKWHSQKYGGDFQDYAIQLDGVEGWVQLTQKIDSKAPVAGETIYGHTYVQENGDVTYTKFKRVMKDNQGYNGASSSLKEVHEKLDHIITILENQPREVVLEDIEDKPIDLSEIPF